MNDNLQSKITQAAISGPDMRVVDTPSQGALFAENIKLSKKLENANPGKVVIVRDKAIFKPDDFCEKFADLLVNPVNRTLNDIRLKMKVEDFLELLCKTYGPKYKVTDD